MSELPSVVTRRATKDGRWLTVESNAMPIFDAHGNVTHILGSARDITEREELRIGLAEIDALYRLADAIARTTSLTQLFDEAIDILVSVTSADRASILLLDETDAMRFVAWRGLSDAYRTATDGHSPWTADAVDPQPVLVPDVASTVFDPPVKAAVRLEAIGALSFIPLVHDDRLLGKFMLYRDEPDRGATGKCGCARRSRTISRRPRCEHARVPSFVPRASSSRRSCARSTKASSSRRTRTRSSTRTTARHA